MLSLSLSLYIYIYICCEGNSIAFITYRNLLVGFVRYVLNILIDFLRCAENCEKELENRQIKVINYHRAFKRLYFRGNDMHRDPECLESPFYKHTLCLCLAYDSRL